MIKSRVYTGIAMLHDLIAATLAWWFAYLLRFNFDLPLSFKNELWSTLIWVIPLQCGVFWAFSLYRGVWRYASVADLRRILFAVIAATALIPLVLGLFRVSVVVPRAVLIIDPLLLMLMMGGSRLLYRMWKENLLYGSFHLQGEPVLVLGAGEAGVALSKDLARNVEWHQVGFLDDDPSKQGCTLNGIKVLGKLEELTFWVEKTGVQQVIIAIPSGSHQQRKRAIQLCNQAEVQALTLPSFDDLMSGKVAVSQLRAIELDDLLGRDPVVLDDAGLHGLLTAQVVMVTGAGGSIGSELCRQIARFTPSKLMLFEQSEFALYTLEQELRQTFPALNFVCLVGDVRDAERVAEVMANHQPRAVFHAAAYKHVPMMEQHNAWQAIRNNVLGTWTVARAAQQHNVAKFVMISTDKAVNPTNVMGASKRLAELVCQALQPSGSTRFVMVRFGNVLGSTGSVIPKFRAQIAQGGPITVTHPEITRYFMSIPEAAQLVLQAGLMGQGGEIFVLNMGEPVKILDLARNMIVLNGLVPEKDIEIKFTGLKPGEKMYEELFRAGDIRKDTGHSDIFAAVPGEADSALSEEQLQGLKHLSTEPDIAQMLAKIKELVPAYTGWPRKARKQQDADLKPNDGGDAQKEKR